MRSSYPLWFGALASVWALEAKRPPPTPTPRIVLPIIKLLADALERGDGPLILSDSRHQRAGNETHNGDTATNTHLSSHAGSITMQSPKDSALEWIYYISPGARETGDTRARWFLVENFSQAEQKSAYFQSEMCVCFWGSPPWFDCTNLLPLSKENGGGGNRDREAMRKQRNKGGNREQERGVHGGI